MPPLRGASSVDTLLAYDPSCHRGRGDYRGSLACSNPAILCESSWRSEEKTLSQNSGTSCLHQALEAAAWRLMASADERPPLATLTTAHAASNEVSERRGREGWCARSLSDLVERATATQSFVIYTPHELHTTFPRATRELRARLNIEVTLNMPSPRALAPPVLPRFHKSGIRDGHGGCLRRMQPHNC